MTLDRYLPTYRKDEVNQIARCARSGHSLAYVGIAGCGKSNLIRYVRDPQNIVRYVGDEGHHIRFPLVDLNAWDGSAAHLWQLFLMALLDVTGERLEADQLPVKEGNVAPWIELLKIRLNQTFQHPLARVTFVLDDCDAFLQKAPAHLVEQLYALRNEHYRDLLGFLLFTKKLPHILLRRNDASRPFKFYDLFSNHIFALSVHTHPDAFQMLTYLNFKEDAKLDTAILNEIYALSGGHSRLLYLLFYLWLQEAPPVHSRISYLANHPMIRNECHRIMDGLHRHEQEAALDAISHGNSLEFTQLFQHLVTRGLLTRLRPLEWFSPIMPITLTSYQAKGDL